MAYFPLFFDLSGRRVLVVGAGQVARRRIGVLRQAGACLTVVSREIPDDLVKLAVENNHIRLYPTDYRDYRKRFPLTRESQGGFFLVLAATGDQEADRLAAEDARTAGSFVNIAGVREASDFYFPGIAVRGSVTAGIIAGGEDHHLARRMTEAVRNCLMEELTDGEIRSEIQGEPEYGMQEQCDTDRQQGERAGCDTGEAGGGGN